MGFVNQVALIAQAEDHHPDLHVSYSKVTIELWTHAVGGLSENDFILAAKIDNYEDYKTWTLLLIIEEAGLRILTDPGIFTTEQNEVKNIDIILITTNMAIIYISNHCKQYWQTIRMLKYNQ